MCQNGDFYIIVLMYVRGTGHISRQLLSARKRRSIAPFHGQLVHPVGSTCPCHSLRSCVERKLAAEPAPAGQGQDDAFKIIAFEKSTRGVDAEPDKGKQMFERELILSAIS